MSLQVMGVEWAPLGKFGNEILTELNDGDRAHPMVRVTNEMVTRDGTAVKSSTGDQILIDEVLDQLVRADQVRRAARGSHVGEDEIAAIVLLASCLHVTANKRIALEYSTLLSDSSPGWALARAWATCQQKIFDGAADPHPEDPCYRYLVLRSLQREEMAERAWLAREPADAIRHYVHLSARFCEVWPSGRTARLMRTVLGEGLASLGLIVRRP